MKLRRIAIVSFVASTMLAGAGRALAEDQQPPEADIRVMSQASSAESSNEKTAEDGISIDTRSLVGWQCRVQCYHGAGRDYEGFGYDKIEAAREAMAKCEPDCRRIGGACNLRECRTFY
jgi:hypothetical protein